MPLYWEVWIRHVVSMIPGRAVVVPFFLGVLGVGDFCRDSVLITGVTGLESPPPDLKHESVVRVEFNFVFFPEDVDVLEVS